MRMRSSSQVMQLALTALHRKLLVLRELASPEDEMERQRIVELICFLLPAQTIFQTEHQARETGSLSPAVGLFNYLFSGNKNEFPCQRKVVYTINMSASQTSFENNRDRTYLR
jgi:hypothetical protein